MIYFVQGFCLAMVFPFFVGIVEIIKHAFNSGVSFAVDD